MIHDLFPDGVHDFPNVQQTSGLGRKRVRAFSVPDVRAARGPTSQHKTSVESCFVPEPDFAWKEQCRKNQRGYSERPHCSAYPRWIE
jgi:hypothetical protein